MTLLRFVLPTALMMMVLTAPVGATEEAGDRWRSVKTAHFDLLTDLSANEARATILALEEFRSAWLRLFPESATPPATVVQVRKAADFRRLVGGAGARIRGVFVPALTGNTVVLAPGAMEQDNEVLFHEFAHVYHRASTELPLPGWYREGLAEVFSSVALRNGTAIIGTIPNRHQWVSANFQHSGDLEWVLEHEPGLGEEPAAARRFYGTAWLLTHYLLLGHLQGGDSRREDLDAFLKLNASGTPSLDAFRRSIMEPAALVPILENYLHSIPRAGIRTGETQQTLSFETRTLPETEVVLKLAQLALRVGARGLVERLSEIGVEQIGSDDVAYPRALSLRAEAMLDELHFDGALKLADEARLLAPADPEVLRIHASVLTSFCLELRMRGGCPLRMQDALAEFDRALRMAPVNAAALYGRGLALALLARYEQAIAAFESARELAPWSVDVQYQLGIAHLNARNTEAALDHLRRVRSWSKGGANAEHAVQLIAALERPLRRR